MAAVQTLRAKAHASEKLKTTEQQKVTARRDGDRQIVAIEPADPETVYVPYYDPAAVYGEWPYADYPPYYWNDGYIGIIGTGIAFGAGYALWRWIKDGRYWGGHVNWNRNQIDINRGNRVEHWQHDPRHRGNVPYRDAHVAQRFGDANRAGAREAFRGKADAGRRDLATKAGAAAAGAAAAGAAAKARGAGAANAKRTGKAKAAAKSKSAAHSNRATHTRRAAKPQHAARTSHSARTRAATHARHVQRTAVRPNVGARGRAFGYRGGGGGRAFGGGRGGGRRSDVALKHDIVLLARLDNGLGFYRFAYIGSNKVYVGVLAQEVQNVMPGAVTRGRDGYLRVHYDQIGVRFQTYRQWTASGARIPGG
jgi:hypothetical protein